MPCRVTRVDRHSWESSTWSIVTPGCHRRSLGQVARQPEPTSPAESPQLPVVERRVEVAGQDPRRGTLSGRGQATQVLAPELHAPAGRGRRMDRDDLEGADARPPSTDRHEGTERRAGLRDRGDGQAGVHRVAVPARPRGERAAPEQRLQPELVQPAGQFGRELLQAEDVDVLAPDEVDQIPRGDGAAMQVGRHDPESGSGPGSGCARRPRNDERGEDDHGHRGEQRGQPLAGRDVEHRHQEPSRGHLRREGQQRDDGIALFEAEDPNDRPGDHGSGQEPTAGGDDPHGFV
jgi:hypothetical protein